MKAGLLQLSMVCAAVGAFVGPLGAGESGPGVTTGASSRPDITIPAGVTVRAGKADDAIGDVAVEQGGTLDLHGHDIRVQGLSGAGTVTNGGKTPATLTIEGDAEGGTQTFSGSVGNDPDGAPLSVEKTGARQQVTTAP